jgi:hypothetical protein
VDDERHVHGVAIQQSLHRQPAHEGDQVARRRPGVDTRAQGADGLGLDQLDQPTKRRDPVVSSSSVVALP